MAISCYCHHPDVQSGTEQETGTSNWVMNEVDRKEGRAKPFPGLTPTPNGGETGLSHLTISWIWIESEISNRVSHGFLDSGCHALFSSLAKRD